MITKDLKHGLYFTSFQEISEHLFYTMDKWHSCATNWKHNPDGNNVNK